MADLRTANWRDSALCAQADPDRWFPDSGSATVAKRICTRCPVQAECLDWAITNDEPFGVSGGLSARERRRLSRQRRQA